MVFYYDTKELSLITAFRVKATCWPHVLNSPEFYVYNGITFVFCLLVDIKVISLPDVIFEIDVWKMTGTFFGLTVFAVVTFSNVCYTRYYQLYQYCCQVDDKVKIFTDEVITSFGFDDALRQHTVASVKFVLSAVFHFFGSLDGVDDGLLVHEWRLFEDKGLLSRRQIEFAQTYPGDCVNLFLSWAQAVCQEAALQEITKERYTPPERAGSNARLVAAIVGVANALGEIQHMLHLPVPYPYFHLLSFMLSISLLLGCFGCVVVTAKAGVCTYCVAELPFLALTFILLGLRQIAGDIAEPFGNDIVDFPAKDMMRNMYDHAVLLLEAKGRFDVTTRGLQQTAEFTPLQLESVCDYHMDEREIYELKRIADSERCLVGTEPYITQCHAARKWVAPEDFSHGRLAAQWMAAGVPFKDKVFDGKLMGAATGEPDQLGTKMLKAMMEMRDGMEQVARAMDSSNNGTTPIQVAPLERLSSGSSSAKKARSTRKIDVE
eukprot:TRINITY_DN30925_c0_g1_i1.p1 TRINITY_DN30925_c0_g1~~TRINITY_DN30925_c0_g1_i1.p1  ORF type:complete len:491 (-),score=92.15 TRINITY_DN30925_c0_g1_i1:196-1668(-)